MKKSINSQIREFREKKGYTRDEFAEFLETTAKTLQNIETDGNSVKVEYLEAIGKKFPDEVNFNQWINEAVGLSFSQINEPQTEYLKPEDLTEDYFENRLTKILKEIDATFENPQTKFDIAELMLKMVRDEKKKLES